MGPTLPKEKKRTSTLGSRNETVSTNVTTSSRGFRLTNDSLSIPSQRNFSYQIDNYLQRIPEGVIDQISKFLTVSDLINLQCTNSQICERFYNSLPYSIRCHRLLYHQYDDRLGVAKRAFETKSPDWINVLQGFIQSRNELHGLRPNLTEAIRKGFQERIIYPPLLMDEITREGLSSDFQRQVMHKLNAQQQAKSVCHTVTELQMLNECRQFLKKEQDTMLQVRMLKYFLLRPDLPKLVKNVVMVLRAIYTLLQVVSQGITMACEGEDSIGFMDFYLYNWQMFKIWMKLLDMEAGDSFALVDVILREQHDRYDFPPFTLHWGMMSLWHQHVYSKVRHRLRTGFVNCLQPLRHNENKYQKYLLRDYHSFLMDLSVHQGNIFTAGHSKFEACPDLETIYQLVDEQTKTLYQETAVDYDFDWKQLQYVFQQHQFENRIIPTLIELRLDKCKSRLKEIYNSPEYERRMNRMKSEEHIALCQQEYVMQVLNKNKYGSLLRRILNLEKSTAGDRKSEEVRMSISYQKVEQDIKEQYLETYNKELLEEIKKLVKCDVENQENILMRDAYIQHRIQPEFQAHLLSYDELMDLAQFKQILKQIQKKKPAKASSETKGRQNSIENQIQFKETTLISGMNLAQCLREQFIEQQ